MIFKPLNLSQKFELLSKEEFTFEFWKVVDSDIKYFSIVESSGESCSSVVEPKNLFYSYKG